MRFGGLLALDKVSFQVEEGEIMGVIGPNGAGKSTLYNVLSGVFRPVSGQIFFHGEDITARKPHIIAKKGLIRTYQTNKLFNITQYNVLRHFAPISFFFPFIVFYISQMLATKLNNKFRSLFFLNNIR